MAKAPARFCVRGFLCAGSAGNQTVTQPVIPGVPRAGNRGQVAGAASSIISQNYGPSKLSAGKAPAPSLSSFAAAGYRAGSSLRTSGAMGGVTAWRPPKPVMSYEQAAKAAERLYGEYNQKKTGFDERYGGLEHPEMYYGWKQRGDELAALKRLCKLNEGSNNPEGHAFRVSLFNRGSIFRRRWPR